MICSAMVLKNILLGFYFVLFLNVTVLCSFVARIRDGAGGRVIALSAEITSLEAGAFIRHIIY